MTIGFVAVGSLHIGGRTAEYVSPDRTSHQLTVRPPSGGLSFGSRSGALLGWPVEALDLG
jgi:hypothetical protein